MGQRNLILIIAAIAIGLIAVVLANAYFSGVEEAQERVAEEQQLARIAVASQPLEFGTVLTPENVRLQNFPANSIPEGSFLRIEDLLQGGRVALRPIVPGEPILASKVSGSGGRAVLSANLPEGMRAVSIPVSAVTGVSGFVRPGDSVDVLLTRQIPGDGATAQDLMTDIVLDNVQVLAIDQIASENATEPSVGNTAVVQTDLFGAQKLVLANRIGQLSLVLRNVENQADEVMGTVTARDLGDPAYYLAARNTGSSMQQSAGMFAAPVPYFPGAAPQAAPQPRRPTGPTMTIYRGIEATEEPVGRLGG